ncbi:MAG TPA: glycosyltransferase family protein [Gemmatimonadales bacterium]|nr:glycosyltransferase family protein [Gemmatimonadales bacterium]
MRIVATIEARMTSSRLPGKVLRPVLGRPLLSHMIERLRRSWQLDQVVVATTHNETDDPIAELAAGLGVGCFRGSEDDVLSRVLGAAQAHDADLIVETTGDCPLIDPEVVDQMIATFLSNKVDYCANVLKPTYPRGMDVQVFPTEVLARVEQLTTDPADREHVSLYIYEHPGQFRLLNVSSGLREADAEHRLTVDTAADLALVEQVFERLYPSKPHFGLHDILDLLRGDPVLAGLNRHITQKAVR